MKQIKQKILLVSAGLVSVGVLSSIATSLLVSDPEMVLRLAGVNTTLIVGSIGLFFVGFAYPKD